MDSAIKSRAAARSWITRTGKKLVTLCQNPDSKACELRTALQDFDQKLAKLTAAQDAVQELLDTKDIESDIDCAAAFEEEMVFPVVNLVQEKLAKFENVKDCDNVSVVSSSSVEAKLPKLELPVFEGEQRSWTAFWEQFDAVVHQSDLPTVSKFTYLRSLLAGEAKTVIAGLALTAVNYDTACQLLKNRYGRTDRIIFAHISDLLTLEVPKLPTVPELWGLYNNLQSHVRSLESLGITGTQYGVILTPLILSRLPDDLRMEWVREGDRKEREEAVTDASGTTGGGPAKTGFATANPVQVGADLEFLMEFLSREIQRRETSQTYSSRSGQLDAPPTSASALHAGSRTPHVQGQSSNQAYCGLCCAPGHTTVQCRKLRTVPVEERRTKIKNVCWKCLTPLKPHHNFRFCKAKCSKCNGSHHAIMCTQNKPDKQSSQNTQNSTTNPKSKPNTTMHTNTSPSVSHTNVALQTLYVSVGGKKGEVKAVVLFDTGSDRSYVSQRVIDQIGGEWIENKPLAFATFGSEKVSNEKTRGVYRFTLQGKGKKKVVMNATAIPTLCAPICQPCIPDHLLVPLDNDTELVSIPEGGKVKVDILIGLDAYWGIMKGEVKFLTPKLTAQKSLLGWVLSGCVPAQKIENQTSHSLFCQGLPVPGVENWLWDLEAIGVVDRPEVSENLTEFQETVTYNGERYSVALPWKEGGKEKIMPNKSCAQKRLQSLMTQFKKKPELGEKYHQILSEMWKDGIIEEVKEQELSQPQVGPVFYLPHRPVIKESSASTKVRPVFDASAKSYNGYSLNDCVETGPNLLPDLVGILLRFRRWKVALTTDIVKAFLQIGIHPEDRDAHRFVWDDVGTMRVMRFTRVPFGNKASPFLLMATIKHHLATQPPTHAVNELNENLYMDDWLSGCDDEQTALDMFAEAQKIMTNAGMQLSKWSSNSESVCKLFGDNSIAGSSTKVLGMKWDAKTDVFSFEGITVDENICLTKRVVLSIISRLFDPLGLVAPFSVKAKTLFQTIWQEGLDWDQKLSGELSNAFREWVSDLTLLKTWTIPRRYFNTLWSARPCLTLHAFGDASEKAYGACVYLVSESEGKFESILLMSRVRVAPLKKTSLPRLELLGALLCARLLGYVCDALKLQNVQKYCWTDSTVTLAWIRSDPSKWKVFVANRVSEIHTLTEPSSWGHCPGKTNPADLVTRGLTACDLMKSHLWLHGPVNFMTAQNHETKECETNEETKRVTSHTLLSKTGEEAESGEPVSTQRETVFAVERHSTFTKALRVIAYVLRFVNNLKAKVNKKACQSGELTYKELTDAKVSLFMDAQMYNYEAEIKALKKGIPVPRTSSLFKLSPFLGKDGLIRIQGRLQFANLPEDSQHPIIVPKGHLAILLARRSHIRMKHAGVNSLLTELRNSYWIIGARRICKMVKRGCVACQRFDALPPVQPMAPLPKERVTQAPPFSVTGLDHAGPLYCGDYPGKKFYVLLFTCAVTRAVHLELVDSLSCEETLLAMRRFFARRGVCTILWSDNAKGFVAASTRLLETMGTEGPEWKFIAPRAPWWGGFWERVIGSVKSALRKTLGRQCLCRRELETLLQEVESCVNSRPLTFVGDELDSRQPLTPFHFLLGRASHSDKAEITSAPELDSNHLSKLFEKQSEILQGF